MGTVTGRLKENRAMERIHNIDVLEKILSKEDPLWQRRVYEEIGVAVLPWKEEKPYWGLISSCGLADLEDDAEHRVANGRDESSCCDICSIEQLISYIKRMDTYRNVLQDISLGEFNKSDLFWAVYYRILFLNRYPNDFDPYMGGRLIYGMRAIEGPGSNWLDAENGENSLWLDTSVCGIDVMPGTIVHLGTNDILSDVVANVANLIREYSDIQDTDDTFSSFIFDPNAPFHVPSTFDEVVSSYKLICY